MKKNKLDEKFLNSWLPCSNFKDCDSKCLIVNGILDFETNKDQQEWCKIQDRLLSEKIIDKQQKILWELIISITPYLKSKIKQLSSKFGFLELEELVAFMQELLFTRWFKMLKKGSFVKRTGMKGYISTCLNGELIGMKNKQKIESVDYYAWIRRQEAEFFDSEET